MRGIATIFYFITYKFQSYWGTVEVISASLIFFIISYNTTFERINQKP